MEPRHVSRPEVAAALVAEALLEHPEASRRHAPLVAQLAVVMGDAPVLPPTPGLASVLLAHLVAALSMPHLQLQRSSGAIAISMWQAVNVRRFLLCGVLRR